MSRASRIRDAASHSLRALWQLHDARRTLEARARIDGLTLHDAKRLLATRAAIARHEHDCGEPIGAVEFA